MKRSDLVAKLELVSPALSSNDILPILTHYWFTGKNLVAYNGNVGIVTSLKTEFSACVPAALLKMMQAAGAKEVDFDVGETAVKIKSGKSRINLVTMDPDAFKSQCSIPATPEEEMTCKTSDFLNGLRACLRSVSGDTSIPDQLGVTLIAKEGGLQMFATNGQTLSFAFVKFKGKVPIKDRCILSTLFCKQVLELADDTKKLRLAIDNDRAVLATDQGTLFGILITSEKPLPYPAVFAQHYKKDRDGELFPLATKLRGVLDRACVIASGESIAIQTRVVVKAGLATFTTESQLGKIKDTMQLVAGHPDAEIDIDPKQARAGCEDFDSLLITDRCFVMANRTAFYLIAGKG